MRILLVCVISLCLFSTDAFGVFPQRIIGSSIDRTVPPPPSGLCSTGTFTMANNGTLVLTDNTTSMELGLGSLENSYAGIAYLDTRTITNDTRQTLISMSSFAITTSSLINTVNVPDASTLNMASHYNVYTSYWTVVGRQSVGVTCGGSVCMHIRTYTSSTIIADVITSQASTTSPQVGPFIDSVNTYVLSNTGGGQNLAKLSTAAYTDVDTVFVLDSGVGGAAGLAGDETYIYAPQSIFARILRWPKNSISSGATTFSPGLTAGTLQVPTSDTNGFFYIPARSAGASANVVYRIRTSDMTIQGQINLGNTQFLGKVLVDDVNNKLYIMISSGDTQNQIVRVNRTTLATEATYSGISQTNGPNLNFAQIDIPHQQIYVPINGTGGVERSKIERVSLCVF